MHRTGKGRISVRTLCNELETSRRMVREGLHALAAAGLAVEARQGGWVPGRDPSHITLAQVRSAARTSLRYPVQELDGAGAALAQAFAVAEGAAGSALAESLASFVRRLEMSGAAPAPIPEKTPEAAALPVGVGQGAQKPA